MATPAVVEVIGARALRRDLPRLGEPGGAIIERIKVAGRTAAEPVLTAARAAWPRSDLAHPHHADTLRVTGTKTGATIREGGKAYGGTGWLEFGGSRQGNADRDYVTGGRYLFPAASGLATIVAEAYAAAVQKALDSATAWTNTTDTATGVTQ